MADTLSSKDPFFQGVQGQPNPDPPSRSSTQGDVHWRLKTIEPPGLKFKNFQVAGQFPVEEEGIGIAMNQNVPEAGSYGVPFPFVQWIRGELQVVTLPVVLYSRDKDENIKFFFDEMAKFITYVPELKRIPTARFTYGDIISIKCICRGFGEVKIARPKPDGKARRIDFTMTLARFEKYTLLNFDVNAKPSESRYQVVSGNNRMYERLAFREWGSALHGDRLRKRNRRYAFAAADGEKVKVPSGDIILNEAVKPEFFPFKTDREEVALANLNKYNARNAKILVV
jgi:hypothetical protein